MKALAVVSLCLLTFVCAANATEISNNLGVSGQFFAKVNGGHLRSIGPYQMAVDVVPAGVTPEPATVLLMGAGLVGVFCLVRKKLNS